MPLDPRTPVLVGAGQWSNRVDRGDPPVEPVEMMAEALRRAATDSGASGDLLGAAEAVRVVSTFSRRYRNAARLVAGRIGATPRDEALSPIGGNVPQALINRACLDIAAGDADVVAICGGEAWRTRSATARDELDWTVEAADVPEARLTGPERGLNHPAEVARGLILCSAERAEALGVPRDRWVFPRAGTEAHDTYAVSHRADLRSSPAIRLAVRRLFALAGVSVDDVAHADLYSCFPVAVEIAAAEIGLGLDRPLTVTGGLSFAGGPWNNYVRHSIATMARVLRADPGSVGLVTANG